MFDLITGKTKHMPGGGGGPILVSTLTHGLVLGTIVIVPLMFVTNTLPEVPTMMAFVVTAPPPPLAPLQPQTAPKAAPASSPRAAPVEAPTQIEPEAPTATAGHDTEGVEGGVEGGVPGGIAAGIVGGIPEEAPPPPPPPPAPQPRDPVRIGGQIQQPALIRRVEAVYPDLAKKASVQGTVILEAIVDENGEVQNVKVLRSIPLLDKAAIEAVRQWRYSPVILNGIRVPFVLTVVMSFSIPGNEARY
jgi:protein TonB